MITVIFLDYTFKTVSELNRCLFWVNRTSSTFSFLCFYLSQLNEKGQSALHAVASQNARLNSSGSITSLTSGGNNAMFQQQISNSSNVSIAEEALSIGDVADLLHPQYAIITGGRSREGCPIITFPDHNNFHMLTEHDYEKLISYLTSVPTYVANHFNATEIPISIKISSPFLLLFRLQEADLGFNLIIDRRKDRWTSVKAVLLRISVSCIIDSLLYLLVWFNQIHFDFR